ncbi:hypothetical protein RRG08_062689 [Elysia crispata]|uniref:Uncharacterized protein n=1 Tax=Elysia crispata TaxID=231223 RepID=A0AAE0ZVA7_9GAST|nr:hypothetical protein RRG08_062689 [Elysia crispata]
MKKAASNITQYDCLILPPRGNKHGTSVPVRPKTTSATITPPLSGNPLISELTSYRQALIVFARALSYVAAIRVLSAACTILAPCETGRGRSRSSNIFTHGELYTCVLEAGEADSTQKGLSPPDLPQQHLRLSESIATGGGPRGITPTATTVGY